MSDFHKIIETKKEILRSKKSLRELHPVRRQQQNFKSRLRSHKLTPEAYQALLESQNYCCAVCGQPFGSEKPNIDHCHKTGIVRGLLHKKCNTLLGMSDDNPHTLRMAAFYLERFHIRDE